MNRHVLVTLFESVVFPDVMQVVPPNNDRSLHFHFDDSASQNAAPNQHIASERALFVNVMSFLCLKNHTAQPFRKSSAIDNIRRDRNVLCKTQF